MKTQIANKESQMVNDIDLDMLFVESAKRQQSVDQINATVMRTVRRDLRLKLVLNEAMSLSSMQPPMRIVCIALPLVTIAVLFARNLKNYRLDM